MNGTFTVAVTPQRRPFEAIRHALALAARLIQRVAPVAALQLQLYRRQQFHGPGNSLPYVPLDDANGTLQGADVPLMVASALLDTRHAVEQPPPGQSEQGENGEGNHQLKQGKARLSIH